MSTQTTATAAPVRAARARATSRCCISIARFGRPVTSSWWATYASRSLAWRPSLTSMNVRRMSPSREFSSGAPETRTWRAPPRRPTSSASRVAPSACSIRVSDPAAKNAWWVRPARSSPASSSRRSRIEPLMKTVSPAAFTCHRPTALAARASKRSSAVRAASSACVRSMNCASWLPTDCISSSSGWSGRRTSRLKNSMTPSTPEGRRIGKANAACSPSRAVFLTRSERARPATSLTQIGPPSAHARPGIPTPTGKAARSHAALKASASMPSACQTDVHRNLLEARSTHQTAPSSHPSVPLRSARILGAASATDADCASTRVAAFWTWSRRSAEGRGGTSWR